MLARTACCRSASGIVPKLRRQQPLDRRTDAPDDRAQVAGPLVGWLLQGFERGRDRAALRMPEHHDEPGAEPLGGEFDAVNLRGRDDVSGDADDKQIAEALVEDQFGGHSRIRTSEDDREGLLPGCQRLAARPVRCGVPVERAGHESLIPLAQPRERFRR